jgi:hypothetical protein
MHRSVSSLTVAFLMISACGGKVATDPTEGSAFGTPTGGSSVPPSVASTQQELMDRWNVADAMIVSNYDFQWSSYTEFPHPTLKGGSTEAYQAFAMVLLDFLTQNDDFAFLANNHLFTVPLEADFANGQEGLITTFEALATEFASDPNEPWATQTEFASLRGMM